MEACATAHHWARTLMALGHEVRLIPPASVKPYLRRQKNDAADAAAVCEAVMRPSMRFVPVKSVPRKHSTGGKPRLGSISKMGNRHLRKLLVVGAYAALYSIKSGRTMTAVAE